LTETQQPPPVEKSEHWKMYFDGSLNFEGAGAGVLFILLFPYKSTTNHPTTALSTRP
jgi:hypothetical protein